MSEIEQHDASAAPALKQVDSQPGGGFSASQILWRGVGWRVTLMVFGIVLIIQMAVCSAMLHVYEIEQLAGLREVVRTALAQTLRNATEQPASPLLKQEVEKLMNHTVIKGLAVYGRDNVLLGTYGAPTVLHFGKKSPGSYRSSDGLRYEVKFTSNDIGHPYNIIARLNATNVARRVSTHIHQALRLFFLMSLFITGILMMAMMSLPILRRNDGIMKEMYAQAEGRIHKLAYFDGVTGLPNRAYFVENLDKSIKNKVQGKNGTLAVLSIDLDHFKDINDTMGHEAGDKVLETVAQRLVRSLPDNAVIARSSADEFVIMVPLSPGQPDSAVLAERIFSSMLEPMEIMRETFLVRASIGISIYPHDGYNARDILKNADIALNRAKSEGRDTVRHYSRDFDIIVQKRAQMLRDLRKALELNQLQLHYHPQFDLRTGQIVGVEANLRWWRADNSKEGGRFIPPVEFITIAEQSGLIVPIGEYVLRTACTTAKMWQEKGLPPIRMAVNISAMQFHRSNIVSFVADVLKETKLEPQCLELELTESVFIEDTQGAIDILDQMHQQGIQLAIDDFGTGYSSLSYLRRFPIDRLKIDQSFVRTSLLSPNDRVIIHAIISLGHSLNLKVIAEGVETQEQENLLREEGCDEAQGFKYCRPVSADKFWDFALAYNQSLVRNKKTRVAE